MGVNDSINKEIDLARRVRAAALQAELQRISMIINCLDRQTAATAAQAQ